MKGLVRKGGGSKTWFSSSGSWSGPLFSFRALLHFPQSCLSSLPILQPTGLCKELCMRKSITLGFGVTCSWLWIHYLLSADLRKVIYMLLYLARCSIFLVFVVGGFMLDGLFPTAVREEVILNLQLPLPLITRPLWFMLPRPSLLEAGRGHLDSSAQLQATHSVKGTCLDIGHTGLSVGSK